jgi:hypothetical protein
VEAQAKMTARFDKASLTNFPTAVKVQVNVLGHRTNE